MKFVGDIRKLQKMLEHTDMGITETYLQFNQEDMRELIEAEDVI
jgi:site-specific recombinase XerD